VRGVQTLAAEQGCPGLPTALSPLSASARMRCLYSAVKNPALGFGHDLGIGAGEGAGIGDGFACAPLRSASLRSASLRSAAGQNRRNRCVCLVALHADFPFSPYSLIKDTGSVSAILARRDGAQLTFFDLMRGRPIETTCRTARKMH